jgi:hypothetical protein
MKAEDISSHVWILGGIIRFDRRAELLLGKDFNLFLSCVEDNIIDSGGEESIDYEQTVNDFNKAKEKS